MHSASQAAKASGVPTNINKRRSPAPTACGANLLDNCYSKTLMDTQNMKTVDIKEVILIFLILPDHKINGHKKPDCLFLLAINDWIRCISSARYKSKHSDNLIDIQIHAIKYLH